MALQRPKFTSTTLEEDRKKKAPIPVKLNDEDEHMLKMGMYMFNMHSRSGVLKMLARDGLKVLLQQKSMDEWHYLTRGDRTRIIHERPDPDATFGKGSTDFE